MSVINEEWVSLWYQCLALNLDYQNYCYANFVGDKKLQYELQKKHQKISDIFADFGYLNAWPEDGMNSKMWKTWFKEKQHLFLSSVSIVEDQKSHVTEAGHILIDIPLSQCSKITLQTVSAFLTNMYEQPSLSKTVPPKYSLLTDSHSNPKHALNLVKRACASAARSYRYDLENYEELGYREATTAFIKHEMDRMGWNRVSFQHDEREILKATGEISNERFAILAATVNRARTQFRGLASNAILGRFPDTKLYKYTSVINVF